MKFLKALFLLVILIVGGVASMYFIDNNRSSTTTNTLVKRGYPEEAINTVNELKVVLGEAIYIYENYKESSEKWQSELDLWMVKAKDITTKAKRLSPPPEYDDAHSLLSSAIFSLDEAMKIFPDVINGKPGTAVLGTFINMASDNLETFLNKLELHKLKGN